MINFTIKVTLLGIFQGFCLKVSESLFYRTPPCIFGLLVKPVPGPWTRALKTWTLNNLDPERPGPRKTWTLKNMGNYWIWKND